MKKTAEKAKNIIAKNGGITLVALVITIIVLIILAGVSISAVKEGGLIKNSKTARDEYKKSASEEDMSLASLSGTLEVEMLKEVKAGEYTATENKKYVQGGKTAVIPAGFTVSNIAGENTIDGGLVIYSGEVAATEFTADDDIDEIVNAQEKYNQYVWIPVDNPSDMYGILPSELEGIEGTKFGKLYFKTNTNENSQYNWPTENGYSATSYREPTILSDYTTRDSALKLEKEFNDMIASVEKYKGFYIGRYELTGNEFAPTIKKGFQPMGMNTTVTWYKFYDTCTKLETTNSNAKDKVRATMIWGCQWDQAIKRCLDEDSDFLTTTSKNYGVYSDSEIKTKGETGRMADICSIYDLGGNMPEFTLEGGLTNLRALRGGRFSKTSTLTPASSRDSTKPDTGGTYGCRAQLYIK